MTTTPVSLQDLRRKVYAKAKAEPHWRFWGCRARNRRGFGWERWSTQWLHAHPGTVQRPPGASGPAESRLSWIGPITRGTKQTGERSAGNPPATFEVAGAGNEMMAAGLRATAKAVEHPPEPKIGAPASTLPDAGGDWPRSTQSGPSASER